MTVNEGVLDRGIRVVVGVVLIALAVTHRWAPWGWIGVLPLISGLTGFCGLYQVFGIKTCPMRQNKSS
ncbi:MAG: DUF2892 domain-containing protein [Gammaproteobacteria bacterium]|nr:DUF2892 domain-containing protein [Gammaproteobacteria bacterium]